MTADRDTRTLFEKLIPEFSRNNELLQRVHDEMVTRRGIHRRGAEARPVVIPSAPGGVTISYSPGVLSGWAFRETSGTTGAVLRIRNGQSTDGGIIVPISLSAGESTRDFPTMGLGFEEGLYVELVSGTIEGSVHLGRAK